MTTEQMNEVQRLQSIASGAGMSQVMYQSAYINGQSIQIAIVRIEWRGFTPDDAWTQVVSILPDGSRL